MHYNLKEVAIILISLQIFAVQCEANLRSNNVAKYLLTLGAFGRHDHGRATTIEPDSQLESAPIDNSVVVEDDHDDPNNERQDINKVEWWKKSSYYHIYVRSFRDSDGDGQGDLRGIIEKLDYLKMLGTETVLMAPIYESSMHDGGYDITNHTAINPMFGTMQDFDELLVGLKRRKMRIIMDFVPNHVSTDHLWFRCSERAFLEPETCGKYRDYFIWTNSTRYEGKYPTNWISVFGGGPAWTRSEIRNEFYLRQFLPQQADVNMSNPAVREELKSIARFWLSKGVDGLRVDAMPFFLEDTTYWRDEPINKDWQPGDDPYNKLLHLYTFSYIGTPEIVRDWYSIAKDEYEGDRLIVNEAYASIEDLLYSYGSTPKNRFTDLNFGFTMLGIESKNIGPEMINDKTLQWFNATRELNWPNERGTMNPWLIWVMANHDNPRRIGIVGEENFDVYQWIGFMMPGSPVVYYGDEIGTHDVHPDDIPESTKAEGETRRLPFRALMAWTAEQPSAGFSNRSDNWMALARDYRTHNVQSQLESANTHTHLKNFLAIQNLRTAHLETLIFGDLFVYRNALENPDDENDRTKRSLVYAMARVHEKFGSLLFVVNFNNVTCEKLNLITTDADKPKLPERARVLLLNYDRNGEQNALCGTTSPGSELAQGDEVSLNLLPLGPSQAAILKYY